MSLFLDGISKRAQQNIQTIVLPEGEDQRTLEAAEIILEKNIAQLIILGDVETIQESSYNLQGARIIDNRTAKERERYAEKLYELRKHKGLSMDDALKLMDDSIYFATMMVKCNDADGMVAGACHPTSDVLRAALQILKTAPGVKLVSSFFVMIVPECSFGEKGVFIFSDCGLEINPDAESLAHIAINSAYSWEILMQSTPHVALLSHSSKGSAPETPDRRKVIEATERAHKLAPELSLDGELQLDAAIVQSIGSSKAPDSPVAGRANVLIFPDLDAGNIGYKLVQRLAKAQAYGPITQGLAAPVNDLSRGCSAQDIVGVVAITCVQAQAKQSAN